MRERIHGIVPPMTTPFRPDDTIDDAALRAETRYLVETTRVHGLAVAGSTGEGHALATDEVRRITGIVTEEARGRVPVIAGIITDSTASAVERGLAVKDLGVAALQVTPVHDLFRPDGDAMVSAIFQDNLPANVKHAQESQGRAAGRPRAPMPPTSAAQAPRIREALHHAGLI